MTRPRRTIRRNLLLLGMVPAIVVGLILTIYWTSERIEELRTNLMAKGEAYARFIAPSLEYGIISGNREQLRKSAMAIAADRDITTIRITNHSGLVLYAYEQKSAHDAGNDWLAQLASSVFPEEQFRFLEAIFLNDPISSFSVGDENDGTSPEEVGRVALYLTNRYLTIAQTEVILKTFAIVLGFLVLAWILAHHISRTLSRPLEGLARTVDRIRAGDLDARSTERSPGEIGVLEQGVNEMAATLQRSHQHMVNAIREATAQLQDQLEQIDAKNRELEDARQTADEANRHKSRFVAWVSHEIRTPLNAIEGIIELMLSETEKYSDQCLQQLRMMRQSAQDLQNLTNDLLDISKIESGRFRLNPARFDLHTLAHRTCSALSYSHADRIHLIIDSDVPSHINADPLRYKQIFNNLVGNALKYAGTHEVQVHLMMASHHMLNLIVRDQGMGMDNCTLARIFDPYEQGSDSSLRTIHGTGLGLTITKALTEAMGGRICVHSSPGHGSTFTVRLPVLPAENTCPETPEPEHNEAEITVLEGLHCLVADDDEANRVLTGRQIERMGGTAVLVSDGDEAITHCASECFTIVFLDIHMPRLDGISALQKIRTLPDPPQRIVAITANGNQEILDEYLREGFDAVVSKPLSVDAIAQLLQTPKAQQLSGTALTDMARASPRRMKGAPCPSLTPALSQRERVFCQVSLRDFHVKPEVRDTPIIDHQAAIERAGGNERLTDEMRDILLRDARVALTELTSNTQDHEAVTSLAHKLRGGARLCAAMELEMASAEMENADPTHNEKWIQTRNDLIGAVQHLLDQYPDGMYSE